MKFAQPIWLLIGIGACAALVWRYRRFDQKQRADLAKFASDHLIAQLTASVSTTRRNLKRGLVMAGVALIALSLARPLVGFRWEEAKRKGLDLLIAVDTSKSMLAQDVKPDRLTRAKMAVEDLLQKLEGDRVGLIAFAGNAFLQCPLTLDYDAFRQSLDALDTSIIPRGGTDIAAAVHEAEAALKNNGNHERILVLITDGEDLEGKALGAVRDAVKNGLKIFTVGVGSTNGELIPVPDEKGGTQFLKDASGQFAKSRLDESMLKQIADAASGSYQPLGQQAQGLEILYRDGLSKFTKHDIASRLRKVYLERFQWPLALGLLCLVLEPLLGIRKPRPRAERAAFDTPRAGRAKGSPSGRARRATRPVGTLAGTTAVMALLAWPSFARASAGRAEKAYAKGRFTEAAQEYLKAAEKAPQKAELQFNYGAAAYKAGQHEAAAAAFTKAMRPDNLPLQEDNYYNLGNTRYRLGQKSEKSNPQETIKTWEQAVQDYEAALQLKADDADAKYNRDFVKKKLEDLKKQQEKQKQDQQDQQQQQNSQQNQDNQQNQDQNDRQNSPSDQDKQKPKDQRDQNKQEQKQNASGAPENDEGKDQKSKPDKPDQSRSNQPEPNQPGQKEEHQPASDDPKPASESDGKPEARKDQKDQAGRKPSEPNSGKDRASQKPELANDKPKPDGKEEAEARPAPGQMSKQEAKQLLDSLKNGDRKMPLAPAARGSVGGRDDEPLKDW